MLRAGFMDELGLAWDGKDRKYLNDTGVTKNRYYKQEGQYEHHRSEHAYGVGGAERKV